MRKLWTVELLTKSGKKAYPNKLDIICNEIVIAGITEDIKKATTWTTKQAAEIVAIEYENARVIEVEENK